MSETEEREKNQDINNDSSENNGKKYIMFICKKCGNLCLTLPEYFLLINPGDVMPSSNNYSNVSKKIKIHRMTKLDTLNEENEDSQDEEIKHDNIFPNGLNVFRQLSKSPFFPWCLICTMELEERVQTRIKYLKAAESFYSQLDIPDNSIFQETLEHEVSILDKEPVSYKESDEIITSSKSQEQLKSENSENSINLIEAQDDSFLHQTEDEIKTKTNLFKSLVLPVVFHIGVKGTYATINSLRLGQNKNWSISFNELDKSLFFLALLVKNAGRLANIDVSAIKISTEAQIKIKDDQENDESHKTRRKSEFFTKLSESIFGKGQSDDIISLKAADMRKAKTVERFNQAMDVIFTLSSQIFQSQSVQRDSIMPPNFISPEDHTISDRCYYFDIKDPYEWSHNMRLLLFNYAFMFTFCLRNAVISID